MNLNQVEPQTEIISKAIADGVETVAEYSHWLSGYMTSTEDATAKLKEHNELAWLEDDWTPTTVVFNGKVVINENK